MFSVVRNGFLVEALNIVVCCMKLFVKIENVVSTDGVNTVSTVLRVHNWVMLETPNVTVTLSVPQFCIVS